MTKDMISDHFDFSETAVAARAFEKWKLRGCPLNDAERDWFAAQAEIAAERERHAYDEEIAVYE
jgi:hypothetical protein